VVSVFLFLLSYACFGESPFENVENIDWETADIDQDGWTIADGDCWESSTQPTRVEGAFPHSLTSADIYPTAEDRSYDGVDANCDGADDFDADGDGFVPDEYEGIETLEIDGSGSLPAGDCWDLMSDSIPQDFRVLNGFAQLESAEVFPNRRDRFYDGINQDCGSVAFEFDQDQDGDDTKHYANRDGRYGGDCVDSEEDLASAETGVFEPSEISSWGSDQWYDGVDQNCDGANDYDQDGDGYSSSDYEGQDCNDLDPEIKPNIQEIALDGIDQNCDGMEQCFRDQDGDGYGGSSFGLSANYSCLDVGFSNESTDCDDGDADIYPWAVEGFGTQDENCDGIETQGYIDCYGAWKLGDYYLICDGSEDYEDAEDICTAYGYDSLTQILSSDVNDFIYGYMNLEESYWIGLSDRSIEGSFRWTGYTQFVPFSDWFLNEPNDYNNQDCVSTGINGWHDQSCSMEMGFVCQIR
jgi:hypothetical protein